VSDRRIDEFVAVRRSVESLLDVVEELAEAEASGVHERDRVWLEVVVDTFRKHRLELLGHDPGWPDDEADRLRWETNT
jgi:hypothetical protein